jgi:hypothetical protein
MATEQEAQHLRDVMSLAEALEAALQAWMAREEHRPGDAAVPGGVAEFTVKAVAMCRREIPPESRREWLAAWLDLLVRRLGVEGAS